MTVLDAITINFALWAMIICVAAKIAGLAL
jgi:hypothetical protein